jgi:septal ring factor EnvC (AmiA/AmiB activator)
VTVARLHHPAWLTGAAALHDQAAADAQVSEQLQSLQKQVSELRASLATAESAAAQQRAAASAAAAQVAQLKKQLLTATSGSKQEAATPALGLLAASRCERACAQSYIPA